MNANAPESVAGRPFLRGIVDAAHLRRRAGGKIADLDLLACKRVVEGFQVFAGFQVGIKDHADGRRLVGPLLVEIAGLEHGAYMNVPQRRGDLFHHGHPKQLRPPVNQAVVHRMRELAGDHQRVVRIGRIQVQHFRARCRYPHQGSGRGRSDKTKCRSAFHQFPPDLPAAIADDLVSVTASRPGPRESYTESRVPRPGAIANLPRPV